MRETGNLSRGLTSPERPIQLCTQTENYDYATLSVLAIEPIEKKEKWIIKRQ